MYVQHVEDQLSIVQLALELLADICVQDDSEGNKKIKRNTMTDIESRRWISRHG